MTAEVFTPSDVNVTMTPTAVKHVRKQLDKKPEAKGIRLAIKKVAVPVSSTKPSG